MHDVDVPDYSGALLKGTVLATMIIGLILVLFLRKDSFSQLGNISSHVFSSFSRGFGWFK